MSELFAKAYNLAATPQLAQEGFRTCGIVPFDPNIFTEIDFLPSEVTDQPEDEPEEEPEDEPEDQPEITMPILVPNAEVEMKVTPSTSAAIMDLNPVSEASSTGNGALRSDRKRVSPSDIVPLPKIKVRL